MGFDSNHVHFFGDVSADLPAVKFGGNLLYTTGDDKDDGNPNETDLFVPVSSYFSERNDYDYLVNSLKLFNRGMLNNTEPVQYYFIFPEEGTFKCNKKLGKYFQLKNRIRRYKKPKCKIQFYCIKHMPLFPCKEKAPIFSASLYRGI